MPLFPLLAAALLVSVHLVVARLRFLEGTPRSRWLSFAGGVSVAYVFVHLLPELAEAQEHLSEVDNRLLEWIDRDVYVLALLGLVLFYGLDRIVVVSTKMGREESDKEATEHGLFWIHLSSFTVYNVITGYLIAHREDESALGLLFFAVAMALHFVTTDYALRKDYQAAWHRLGKWILSGAVLGGLVLGLLTEVNESILLGVTGFLGGGIILNVLKEELPEERQSRFGAFLLGVVGYAGLLLVSE